MVSSARAPRLEAKGTEEASRILQVLPHVHNVKVFIQMSSRVPTPVPNRILDIQVKRTPIAIGNLDPYVVMAMDIFVDTIEPSGALSTLERIYLSRPTPGAEAEREEVEAELKVEDVDS